MCLAKGRAHVFWLEKNANLHVLRLMADFVEFHRHRHDLQGIKSNWTQNYGQLLRKINIYE